MTKPDKPRDLSVNIEQARNMFPECAKPGCYGLAPIGSPPVTKFCKKHEEVRTINDRAKLKTIEAIQEADLQQVIVWYLTIHPDLKYQAPEPHLDRPYPMLINDRGIVIESSSDVETLKVEISYYLVTETLAGRFKL